MKSPLRLYSWLLFSVLTISLEASAKELKDLQVLYLGGERTEQFATLLRENVAKLVTRKRSEFTPTEATGFDVVVLDWPQGLAGVELKDIQSPLGSREAWGRPTVLLGSAGLNLAVAWKLKGGSGCTCLDPLSYDLRSHEIFERPFRIDRGRQIRIPTPPDFRAEIKTPEIEVLPLVDHHQRHWNPGWCSYSYDFAANPDVEFFSGGVNHKTPTAAALWRQGNLLHFGFEQSPVELNETGRHLLLNAIAYISRFAEDRPIAITPSVFAGPVARSRARLQRFLRSPDFKQNWLEEMYGSEVAAKFSELGLARTAEWAEREGLFLHPVGGAKLEIDTDLVVLGVPFDSPEFLDRCIGGLRAGGNAAVRAQRLLHRYIPEGPAGDSADAWDGWRKANQRYLFASDSGDYRWYIDPLAARRGVPSAELRGASRADRPEPAKP